MGLSSCFGACSGVKNQTNLRKVGSRAPYFTVDKRWRRPGVILTVNGCAQCVDKDGYFLWL